MLDTPSLGWTECADWAGAIACDSGLPIYGMLPAPPKTSLIDRFFGAGGYDIAINLELWNAAAWPVLLPGKNDIGRGHYLSMLAYAGEHYGPSRVRSMLIVGLEPIESTLLGVRALCSMGVQPMLSAFRPLPGSRLQQEDATTADVLEDVQARAHQIADSFGLQLGPDCPACQNNTLSNKPVDGPE